ncbi:uncharacterized protein LOC134529626 [Bacillus rossius redtenbacheri]|uniref:uncharacterized protein LOC134529626 n=1 Tax=Bacillus rossius redtenbacheri TaxID=93214 RepID=UPI002FDEA9A8
MKKTRPEHHRSTDVIHDRSSRGMKAPTAGGRRIPEQLRSFDVVLQEPDHVFFSGDLVQGRVLVDLDGCLTVQAITVRLVGEAYVNVPEESGQWDHVRRITRIRHTLRRNKISPASMPDSLCGDCSGPATPEDPRHAADCCRKWGKAAAAAGPKRRARPRQHRQAAKFRSYEKYFEHKFFVFGHKYSTGRRGSRAALGRTTLPGLEGGGGREQLWGGSHAFPFDYSLPAKLPASFHGRLGYVRYFCEATLERCAAPALCSRAYFSVGCVADINTEPKSELGLQFHYSTWSSDLVGRVVSGILGYRRPRVPRLLSELSEGSQSGASEQRSTNSCLFCCRKGTVVVSAAVKRRGYVPGELVHVTADVLNMSDRQVRRTCACLRQVVTYFSSKGFRNYVSEGSVSEVQRGAVPSGESDTWCRVPLPVPPVPPTTRFTNCCKLMDIEYRLDFVVELVGDPEPLVLQLPLLVGSVPLQKHFGELMSARDLPDYIQLQPLPAAVQSKYPDLPGATSEPCAWGPRAVDTYYYKQLGRGREQALVVSGTRPQPRDLVFSPRYVCYVRRDEQRDYPDSLARRSAVELPQIVVTRPGACVKHHHDKTPLSRRHSAPAHLVACPPPPPPHRLPGLKE